MEKTKTQPTAAARPAVSPPPPEAGFGRLLFYFGLSLLGVFTLLLGASRRERFDRRWDELDDHEPPEPLEPLPGERPHPAVATVGRTVDGPAGQLFVDDGGMVGSEPPVLFVHGLGGTSEQWRAQLVHLRPRRRAVAFDLRGHGDSQPAAEAAGYGVAGYADDVIAVADALGLDRFVLAGHSLGAAAVVEAAGRHPERVAALLLADPNGDQTKIPRREVETFLDALAKDPEGEMSWYFKQLLVGSEPAVADRVLADLGLVDPAALRASLDSATATSPLPALAAYPGPRLSVISDMNSLPYSLHNLVEDLPLQRLTGTSHWLMMDAPQRFNRVLDEFLPRA